MFGVWCLVIGGRVWFVYVNKGIREDRKRVSDNPSISCFGKFVITTCVFDWGAQTNTACIRTWENAQGSFFLVFLPFAGHLSNNI